jgi:hypothetical protein
MGPRRKQRVSGLYGKHREPRLNETANFKPDFKRARQRLESASSFIAEVQHDLGLLDATRGGSSVRRSLGDMDAKNMFDPIEGPYAGPNTRLGLATVVLWHAADHYGQITLYLRENGIVPPSSRAAPPELQDKY